MATKHKRGEKRIVYCPVDSSTVIASGDLVVWVTDDVRPFSSMADAGTEAQNQEEAHDIFLGVALRSSPSGSTRKIPVATAGVFEFDAVSATYQIGALVGPNGTGAGEAVGVSNRQVVAVATANLAIGRVAQVKTTSTRVQVEIVSTVMRGGPQSLI